MTRPNSLPVLPPWGLQCCFIIISFLVSWYFVCLVSCFLVRCFFFEGLAFHNRKVKDLNSLPVLPLWASGSIWKPLWQNAGITGGSLGGLGHRLGNFVCLCIFSNNVFKKCKTIGSQWMCRTDFDIDVIGQTLKLTHVQTLWTIPLKRGDASLWSEYSLQRVHFF